jgi:hypothetical protein
VASKKNSPNVFSRTTITSDNKHHHFLPRFVRNFVSEWMPLVTSVSLFENKNFNGMIFVTTMRILDGFFMPAMALYIVKGNEYATIELQVGNVLTCL